MSGIFLFDPRYEQFKKPFGALKCGEEVRFSAYAVCTEIRKASVLFFSEYGRREHKLPLEWTSRENEYDVLSVKTDAFSFPDIIRYYFELETYDGETLFFGKNGIVDRVEALHRFRITVYSEEYDTPSWFSKGVTYQVFVDRFFRPIESGELFRDDYFHVHSDKRETPLFMPNENGVVENRDIYGGNLDGVTEKLPYLNELGVRTIYLSPIFEAWSNHKYNTADYRKIDSHFGNEASLRRLCDEARRFDMRIILDGVFSHTGSDSVYFNREGRYGENYGAFREANSPFRRWYDIDEHNKYSSWWGIDTLPQVNELEESYLDFITAKGDSVISHWMNVGVSGWRLDVADELPDEFISRLKRCARAANAEAIVIGEVWEDASEKMAYGVYKKYFTEGVLDGVMNYPLKNAILDFLCSRIGAKTFGYTLQELCENYPECSLQGLMNIIGTHDTVRVINELSVGNLSHKSKEYRSSYTLSEGERQLGKRRLFLAAALQYFFPGSPCIYYGDEIGMEGFEDPFNRRFFTWDDMDADLLAFYRKLGNLKVSESALHGTSERLFFEYAHGDVLILSRGKFRLIVNRGEKRKVFDFKKNFRILLNSEKAIQKSQKIMISPTSVCFLEII